MREFLLAASLTMAIAVPALAAEDKTPLPSITTLDNCAKIEIEVQKVDRPNGTVWLQSVTCIGDSLTPAVRRPSTGSVMGPGSMLESCCTLTTPLITR